MEIFSELEVSNFLLDSIIRRGCEWVTSIIHWTRWIGASYTGAIRSSWTLYHILGFQEHKLVNGPEDESSKVGTFRLMS